MEQKITVGWSAGHVVSLVFGVLGVVYLLIGAAIGWESETNEALVGMIFLLLGVAFLLAAIGIQIGIWAHIRKLRKLVEGGKYLWGEIVQIVPNYSVQVNGKCLYNILVRHTATDGTVHIFKSPNHRLYPDPSIIGKQVRIYYADGRFKPYYVSLDGVLPRVVEH